MSKSSPRRRLTRQRAARSTPRTGSGAVTTRKQWTVMVYMAAGKEDGETERAAIRDLREMEKVGSTGDVDVVVQLDRGWPGYAERYHVERNVSHLISSFPPDTGRFPTPGSQTDRSSSGNPDVLFKFLSESRTSYPAQHYLLVLWGHAYGLGFGRDHGDPLTVKELARVLKKFGANGKLDLLGTNACAMSYAEAVYELRELAEFLVASEITMPYSGWPYVSILQKLGQCRDVAQAGELIVDEFINAHDRQGVALSLVNLSKASVLSGHVTRLAKALQSGIATPEVGEHVTDAFLDSAHGDVRPIVDLSDLCLNLQTVGDNAIVKAASSLNDALRIPAESLDVRRKRLIVKHEADPDFEGLHGLGIFAPAVTSGADLHRLELREEDYKRLNLIRATRSLWARLVYHELGFILESTNAAIAELVAGTGASSRDDREGVGQLLVAVTRSFDKLEGTVERVERTVNHALGAAAAAPSRREAARSAAKLKPSLPFLRLTIDDQALDAAGRSSTLRTALPPGGLRDDVLFSLRLLEDRLASVEKLLRRVLTNGRLGLGAGDAPFKSGLGSGLSSDPPFKLGLGAGDAPFKPGLGAGDAPFKPGLGDVHDPFKPGFGGADDPFKPGFGDLDDPFKPGFGVTKEGFVATGSMLTVVDLFRLVALSLRALELTLARLEKTVLGANFALTISVEEARLRTVQQGGRQFRTLKDQVIAARETSLWVLRHPTQGLGPGVVADSVGRRQLASVGGLSSHNLQLL
jgi:Clostripain family